MKKKCLVCHKEIKSGHPRMMVEVNGKVETIHSTCKKTFDRA